MPENFDAWSDQHWDRVLAQQTTQLETVKLLVTFTAGLAGTLVATALQVPGGLELDRWACVVLAGAAAATIAVIALDSSRTPNRDDLVDLKNQHQWTDTDPHLLIHLRTVMRDTTNFNARVVLTLQRLAELQILLAVVASVIAALSLLTPQA